MAPRRETKHTIRGFVFVWKRNFFNGETKVLDRKDEKIQVCQSSQNLSGFPLSDLFTDFLRENERKTLSFCRNGDFCSNGFVMVFLLSELPAGREKRRTKALQWLSFPSPFMRHFLVFTSLVRETLIFATKQ